METELGQYLFCALNQNDVLQLTFARKTVSRNRLKVLARRRARAKEHIDQGSAEATA